MAYNPPNIYTSLGERNVKQKIEATLNSGFYSLFYVYVGNRDIYSVPSHTLVRCIEKEVVIDVEQSGRSMRTRSREKNRSAPVFKLTWNNRIPHKCSVIKAQHDTVGEVVIHE